MPRRTIRIASGPVATDFQDDPGGLANGLANALATLAALPTQRLAIQQQGDLQLAQVNRQNRRDSMADALSQHAQDRQDRLDQQNEDRYQAGQDRQTQADAERNAEQFGIVPNIQIPMEPTKDQADLLTIAGVGKAKRDQAAESQTMENALRGAHVASEGARGLNGVIDHIAGMFGMGKHPGAVSERSGWQVEKGTDGKFYRFNRGTGEIQEAAPTAPAAAPTPAQAPVTGGPAMSLQGAPAAGGPGWDLTDTLRSLFGGAAATPAGAPPQAAPGMADAMGTQAATPSPAGKRPVSLSQARTSPQFRGMSDQQIRDIAAQHSRQVIP